MKNVVVKDATARLPGLAMVAGAARRRGRRGSLGRGAVLICTTNNTAMSQSIPFDVLKAQEDF